MVRCWWLLAHCIGQICGSGDIPVEINALHSLGAWYMLALEFCSLEEFPLTSKELSLDV